MKPHGIIRDGGCDQCDKLTAVAVVGSKPDWDSSTAHVCRECLLDALKALEECEDSRPRKTT